MRCAACKRVQCVCRHALALAFRAAAGWQGGTGTGTGTGTHSIRALAGGGGAALLFFSVCKGRMVLGCSVVRGLRCRWLCTGARPGSCAAPRASHQACFHLCSLSQSSLRALPGSALSADSEVSARRGARLVPASRPAAEARVAMPQVAATIGRRKPPSPSAGMQLRGWMVEGRLAWRRRNDEQFAGAARHAQHAQRAQHSLVMRTARCARPPASTPACRARGAAAASEAGLS